MSKRISFSTLPPPIEPTSVRREFDDELHMMEALGGSFVKSLAACYYAADLTNKTILRKAFKHYFDEYKTKFEATRTDSQRQLETAQRAFSQDPTPALATSIRRLQDAVLAERRAS